MKYSIGDTFFFTDIKVEKKIIDREKIDVIIIYYMDDLTSYSEEQLDSLVSPKSKESYSDIYSLLFIHQKDITNEYERIMKEINFSK